MRPAQELKHRRGNSRATAPLPAARPSTTRPGADLLALQRLAGNDAVVRALQRSSAARGPAGDTSAVHEVLRSGGRPLEAEVRQDMEARFGADFSTVRLHTGTRARTSAAAVGAHAFTSGEHIVLGDGGADRHTLAHELAHVLQQRTGPVAGTDTGDGLAVSNPADAFERAAEATAHRVLTSAPANRGAAARPSSTTADTAAPSTRATAPATSVQRMENPHAGPSTAAEDEALTGDDVQAMLDARRRRTNDPHVDAALAEAAGMARHTEFTGGGAVRLPRRTTRPGPHDVPGQGGNTVPRRGGGYLTTINPGHQYEEDQIATLTHELTHVSIDRSYGHFENVTGAARQLNSPANSDFTAWVHQHADYLIRLLPDSGLPAGYRQAAEQKLRFHTKPNPHLEFDAVLAQLLVWSDEWGDPQSAFHQHLVTLTAQTSTWRAQGATPQQFGTSAAQAGPSGTQPARSSRRSGGHRSSGGGRRSGGSSGRKSSGKRSGCTVM